MRAAALAAGLMLASPALAQEMAAFEIGGVKFEVPIPDGFCLPGGQTAAAAEIVARADTINYTALTLFACDFGQAGSTNAYYMVKAPKSALNVPVTRPQTLAALSAELDTPAFKAATAPDKLSNDTANAISSVTKMDVKVATEVSPRGADESCVYFAGVVSMAANGQTFNTEMSGCMTAVEPRIVFVYFYQDGKDAQRSINQLPLARGLAMSIRRKD